MCPPIIYLLILICGMVIGSFLTILRGAFVFRDVKKVSDLEDGEVMLLRAGNRRVIWANAQTILGAFHALILMLFFRRPSHFLHRKTTMTTFVILVTALSVIYASSTYAFYHHHVKREVEREVQKEIDKVDPHHKIFKRPKLESENTDEKQFRVKRDTTETNGSVEKPVHDIEIAKNVEQTKTNNRVEKRDRDHDREHDQAREIIKRRYGFDYKDLQRERDDDRSRNIERPRNIDEAPRTITKVPREIQDKVQEEVQEASQEKDGLQRRIQPRNLVQDIKQTVVSEVNNLLGVLSIHDD